MQGVRERGFLRKTDPAKTKNSKTKTKLSEANNTQLTKETSTEYHLRLNGHRIAQN